MSESLQVKLPLKYEVEVLEQGRIELHVPFPVGQKIVVTIVQEAADSFSDLVAAATSSIDFWDNSIDDAEWNDD
jgi:hypothetical protein